MRLYNGAAPDLKARVARKEVRDNVPAARAEYEREKGEYNQ